MSERGATRFRTRRLSTRHHARKPVQKHTYIEMIEAAIIHVAKARPKNRPGARVQTIMKYIFDRYNIPDRTDLERGIDNALQVGLKKGWLTKGILGFYRLGNARISVASAKTDSQETWTRVKLNRHGEPLKTCTRKVKGKNKELRRQRRIDYSLYMSSSEGEEDSDSSLTTMTRKVDESSYMINKENVNTERTLRPPVRYIDYSWYMPDSDSD